MNPKHLLFWLVFLPLSAVMVAADAFAWMCMHFFAAFEVFEELLDRYEHWSFDLPRKDIPLAQIWRDAIDS
jgi:hypothetical protein